MHDDAYVYMQDNASVRRTKVVQNWLSHTGMNILEWLFRSPDMNTIENICGAMVRSVCADGKQYLSVEELKSAILRSWDPISEAILNRHIASMRSCCESVIVRQGKRYCTKRLMPSLYAFL